MDNKQKQELRSIIKNISDTEVQNYSVVNLWRKYGSDFTYQSFRNYLRALRQKGE